MGARRRVPRLLRQGPWNRVSREGRNRGRPAVPDSGVDAEPQQRTGSDASRGATAPIHAGTCGTGRAARRYRAQKSLGVRPDGADLAPADQVRSRHRHQRFRRLDRRPPGRVRAGRGRLGRLGDGLAGAVRIETERDAVTFMRSVKFALRYGLAPSLPLASIYAAAADQRRAIELTNALLARDEVIETNVIAGRLVLAQRAMVPALYVLRTRFRAARLSEDAQRALQIIRENKGMNAGDVRRLLGAEGKRPDRADLALAELMREMLVDRGPSSVPKSGIPYLSKEGFPYRAFDEAHPELIQAAKKLAVPRAIAIVREPLQTIPAKK